MDKAEWVSILTKSMLVVLPIVLSTLFLRYRKNKRKDEQIDASKEDQVSCVLRIPLFYRIVPVFLVVLIFIITIVFIRQDSEEIGPLIGLWLGFGLPGLIMFTCWSLWKVEVKRDEFVYRNFIGVTKTYQYADLEYGAVSTGLKWYFYKNGKKVFCMPYYIENGNKLERVYRKYKSKHRYESNSLSK